MNLFQYITLDREAQELLEANLPAQINCIVANRNDSEEQLLAQFLTCDLAFGNVPAKWLELSPKIKWLQLESVGYDPYVDFISRFPRQVVLTNLHGFFGRPVAESALAGILALKRGIDKLAILKEKKEWRGSALRPGLSTFQDMTVLIVGGGNIGQSFKKIISGFDARVVVFGRNPANADITDLDELDQQLAQADIIVSSLPDSKETRNFFDERRFGLMSPSAIFVNVGRGAVADEAALIKILKEGRIGGAVLDVTVQEPLPVDNELWQCENLIIMQHTGGGSLSELNGKVSIFLENLKLFTAGEALSRVVNL